MQETRVRSLGQEDHLEKEMVTHFSILTWRIPRTEESGRLQAMGLQRVTHIWMTCTFTFHHLTVFESDFKWRVMAQCGVDRWWRTCVHTPPPHPLGQACSVSTVELWPLPCPGGWGATSRRAQVTVMEAGSLVPMCQPLPTGDKRRGFHVKNGKRVKTFGEMETSHCLIDFQTKSP